MLNQEELDVWYCQLNISGPTRQLIDHIRATAPSRAVQGNYSNVCGNYCSQKMGQTIQFESHRGELAHIIEHLEHNTAVLEYYDQPPPIELIYNSKSGKKVRTRHTPDFFVLEHNWAGWEEYKPTTELARKALIQPNRYIQDSSENWYCPPGQEFAQKYGLDYRIRTCAELNPIRLRNWTWLEPYFQGYPIPKDHSRAQEILSQVQAQPGLTYAQLLLSVPGIEPDDINWLIAHNQIFINFNTAPLAEPDLVRLFTTKELAQKYEQISPHSSTTKEHKGFSSLIVDVGTPLSWDGEYWEIINPGYDKLQAEKLYGQGNGYLGLLPRHLDKGHHQKLDPDLVSFMNDFIEKHYFTAKNRRASAVYREFQQACQQHNPTFVAPSAKSFRLQIKRQTNYQNLKAREGSRVASSTKPFNSMPGMPRHGELPWESAHIDHTCLDINLVSSLISLATCNISSAVDLSAINLGRCWATLMVDSYSKRIFAAYLSFEPPSYRSCMMVIRICVQRFQRLPQTIITDNGKEFHSVYFKQLLAYYRCTHKYRPAGEPRYGNPVERVFGTTNTLWLHELQGNTQILRKHRQVTKTVNPARQAIWTIGELYQSLEYWVNEIYDRREHFTLGQSPRQAYSCGIALGGKREIRRIEYDATFLILTLPSPWSGNNRVVQPGRGIKINNIYYWCNAFRDPEVEKTSVDVKIDPFNACIAYAYVKGHWHECTSDHYQYLKGRTEKELKVISADLRQRKSGHAQRLDISNTELVTHLQSAFVLEGELLKQRLQTLENQTVLDLIARKKSHPTPGLAVAQSDDVTNVAPVSDFVRDDVDDHLESYGEF